MPTSGGLSSKRKMLSLRRLRLGIGSKRHSILHVLKIHVDFIRCDDDWDINVVFPLICETDTGDIKTSRPSLSSPIDSDRRRATPPSTSRSDPEALAGTPPALECYQLT